MTDKWLSILNDDSNRLICQGRGRCFSMAQLRRQINHLQAAITKKEYQNWVLYDHDGFQFVCAMFAVLTLGRKVLVPAGRNQAVIESLLGHDTGLIGYHPALRKRIDIEISRDEQTEDSGANARVVSSGKWGKAAFYTSGSSGRPKMIAKSAAQLYLEAEILNHLWKLTPNTLFIPLVTHHHIYGLIFGVLLPLLARAGFYLPRNGGLLGVVEPVIPDSGQRVDELVVITSPTIGRQAEQIRVLAEPGCVARDDRPAPVSRIICAGGHLTESNAGKIIDLFDCPLTEVFGSTETGAVATREHKKQQLSRSNPWKLLPGLDAMAVKHRSNTQAGSELRAEFSVWGGHVGGSKEEPVMTGDEVKFVGTNRFELLGRSNQIYKIEGKRMALNHLVEILESCELVSEAVALPLEKNNKEILLCGVVLSPRGQSGYRQTGKSSTDQSIKKHLLRVLDPVLVPRIIRYLDQSPRNEMGKLSQQALIELLVNPVLPELPLIENVRISRDELVFLLSIPMELRFLRGHFENRPIVPGVVLLHWAYHFIEEYWKLSMNFAIVERLKFSKPATPGDKLMFILRRTESGVEFLYQSEHKVKFASGQIPLNPETAGV